MIKKNSRWYENNRDIRGYVTRLTKRFAELSVYEPGCGLFCMFYKHNIVDVDGKLRITEKTTHDCVTLSLIVLSSIALSGYPHERQHALFQVTGEVVRGSGRVSHAEHWAMACSNPVDNVLNSFQREHAGAYTESKGGLIERTGFVSTDAFDSYTSDLLYYTAVYLTNLTKTIGMYSRLKKARIQSLTTSSANMTPTGVIKYVLRGTPMSYGRVLRPHLVALCNHLHIDADCDRR